MTTAVAPRKDFREAVFIAAVMLSLPAIMVLSKLLAG